MGELFGPEVLPAVGEAEWARAYRVRLEEARLRLTEDELAARLQLGAADAVVGWVALLAARVAVGVRGHGQAGLVAAVAAERATVDAALDRARWSDPVTGLRIAVDLGWA